MQDRIRFALTSDQCELLAAFETAGSLAELAKAVARDPSVVSRNLQGLADSGVIEKVQGRWAMTALGRQMNAWTRAVAAGQAKILSQQSRLRLLDARLPSVDEKTALVLVGVQNGFDDPSWGVRNNLTAESNIHKFLTAWRAAGRPVYHVRHQSKEPQSPLRPGTAGGAFKAVAVPQTGETVVEKSANSAFAQTPLEAMLRERGHRTLVIAGFTTNHCVDATARAAGDLGFSVFVVADACVAFERVGPDGTVVGADLTHRVVMANLNQEFATVIDSETLSEVAHAPEAGV